MDIQYSLLNFNMNFGVTHNCELSNKLLLYLYITSDEQYQ